MLELFITQYGLFAVDINGTATDITEAFALACIALGFALALLADKTTLRKIGGIYFARLGRARLSFCMARKGEIING